jgi:hypothetical protein
MNKSVKIVAGIALTAASLNVWSAPFGNDQDINDANAVWKVLVKEQLAGDHMINSVPYTGTHPHGAILETLDKIIKVKGQSGTVIVKRNYGGEGVSKAAVANEPAKFLKAVTVMFKREAGYDSDNQDWFWAKYKPDGTLDQNPAGIKLAGRVAKGANKGCIACHSAAPGGDFVFNNDRFK